MPGVAGSGRQYNLISILPSGRLCAFPGFARTDEPGTASVIIRRGKRRVRARDALVHGASPRDSFPDGEAALTTRRRPPFEAIAVHAEA